MSDDEVGCGEFIVAVLFVALFCVCGFSYEQMESIKQRAIDNGHAIYHPDTGEFVFKGEIEKESSQ